MMEGALNFWLDKWTSAVPLRERFPSLFDCCDNLFTTVAGVKNAKGWHVMFRGTLARWKRWSGTITLGFFYLHPFGSGRDEVTWALEALGEYSTRSIYLKLSQVAAITHFKEVWRARVHPKIKIFLWQLIRSRLRSGVQVAK
jgi:hypothetical protein